MVAAPWNPPTGLDGVLERWLASDWVRPCFAADCTQSKAPAKRASIPAWLDRGIGEALAKRGVKDLYAHQARALEIARARRSFVVATPTASGKSVCFHVPVLQALKDDPEARALYIYPTKALARDQEAGLLEMMKEAGIETSAVVYDGDTPADARRAAREKSRVVITNPDMLHSGILPHHAVWARTFQRLRYVVLDELHTYRGVFGSHVANVLRRLRRIARFHGSDPIFIGATATIGNPGAHASRLFGLDGVDEVLESGAPRGERRMFLFNPPVVNAELGIRASYVKQAVMLAKDLVRAQVPTIVFGHSRNDVEIMLRYLRDEVREHVDEERVMAYRGGYLPAMRRDIERRLRDGEILGVVATNALELGIDIGALDAVICAGYPGSVAATWQRFGRAGRRGAQSVCVLVTSSAPLDQYLAREPEFVLGGKNIEEARIDPDNVEILVQHIKCAAFEAPFARGDSFGAMTTGDTEAALGFLEQHGVVHATGGTWHWAADSYPANNVSLRSIGWHNVVVVDVETDKSFAEMDWRAAHTMLHDRAIYQHDGETFQVERFDYENNKAFVRKVKPDYFTTAMTNKKLAVIEVAASSTISPKAKSAAARQAEAGEACEATRGASGGTESPLELGWGDVSVVEKVVGYKKIKFHTHENAGYGEVMLPEMQMHTTAFWMTVPDARTKIDGLRGVGHALETVATLALMCEPCDLGTSLGDREGGALWNPILYVHEQVPGGTGLAERIYELRVTLLERTARMIASCTCKDGCPACVGPSDARRKRDALEILRGMLAGHERSGDGGEDRHLDG